MERTLAKMIMLAEVEPLNTQDLKQIAEVIRIIENLWFDQMQEGLTGVI